jgi:hypothetical protein
MGISCRSASTYPKDTQGAAVICDQYRIRKLGNRYTEMTVKNLKNLKS